MLFARVVLWVVVVIALVGVAVLVVALLRTAWVAISTLPAAVVAPTVVASLTVIVSVFSVVVTTQRSRANEIEKDHRRQRIPVYEEFLQFMFDFLLAEKTGKERPSEKQAIQKFVDFAAKVALWGGPDLLKAWNEFRTIGLGAAGPTKGDDTNTAMIFALERLMFALREDVGHSNNGLREGDILRLFIDVLDEHRAED